MQLQQVVQVQAPLFMCESHGGVNDTKLNQGFQKSFGVVGGIKLISIINIGLLYRYHIHKNEVCSFVINQIEIIFWKET